jgi:adenosylmethionine-8-amino-7-oxononanoate aminotransferase
MTPHARAFTVLGIETSCDETAAAIVRRESGGRGSILSDIRGKKYIDGVSSLWVTVHGHRKKEINTAVSVQLRKIAHSTLLGLSNVPAILLAEKLVKIAPKAYQKSFIPTAVQRQWRLRSRCVQYWQQKEKHKAEPASFPSKRHTMAIPSVP